jgi:hypothetical protein
MNCDSKDDHNRRYNNRDFCRTIGIPNDRGGHSPFTGIIITLVALFVVLVLLLALSHTTAVAPGTDSFRNRRSGRDRRRQQVPVRRDKRKRVRRRDDLAEIYISALRQ